MVDTRPWKNQVLIDFKFIKTCSLAKVRIFSFQIKGLIVSECRWTVTESLNWIKSNSRFNDIG